MFNITTTFINIRLHYSMNIKALIMSFTLVLASCSATISLPEVKGYKMLTIPSSNYKAGYVVAISTNPPKEDIIFRPALKNDVIIKSTSISIATASTSTAKAEINAKLEQVAEGKLDAGFTKALTFKYVNTRVIDAEHTKLFRDLKNSLEKSSPEERELIRSLTKRRFGIFPPKAKLDVLTGILIADVVFEIDKTTDAGANISTTQLIDLLGADFEVDGASSSKVIGKNVVIGYRANQDIVNILKNKL